MQRDTNLLSRDQFAMSQGPVPLLYCDLLFYSSELYNVTGTTFFSQFVFHEITLHCYAIDVIIDRTTDTVAAVDALRWCGTDCRPLLCRPLLCRSIRGLLFPYKQRHIHANSEQN